MEIKIVGIVYFYTRPNLTLQNFYSIPTKICFHLQSIRNSDRLAQYESTSSVSVVPLPLAMYSMHSSKAPNLTKVQRPGKCSELGSA